MMMEYALLAVCLVALAAVAGLVMAVVVAARSASQSTRELRLVTEDLLAATITMDPRLRAHIASEILKGRTEFAPAKNNPDAPPVLVNPTRGLTIDET